MINSIKSNYFVMFIISFLVSFLAVWLVFSHFRHTLMNKMTGQNQPNSSIAYAETPTETVVAPEQSAANDNAGCGCPACCTVSEVL